MSAAIDRADVCPLHGEKEWIECWNCDMESGSWGFSHHECGEDCCMCLDPEPNVRCDVCSGKGGWLRCYGCVPMTESEALDA